MAKSAPKTAPKTADAAETVVTAELAADAKQTSAPEAKVPLAKMRGPRGVAESAKIKVLVPNPKRLGSKAHRVFSCYKDGMAVGEFCDAVDATPDKGEATPNLVYDAAHKFIEIEGYIPGQFFEPKPKAPKAEKPAKAPKASKVAAVEKTPEEKAEQAAAHTAEIGESTETETME